MEWEYLCVMMSDAERINPNTLQHNLDVFGSDGWGLVQIVPLLNAPNAPTMIFKRPKGTVSDTPDTDSAVS